MSLFETIQNYRPMNRQEECDKEQMLQFMMYNKNYLERENQIAHFTASMWTVNKERTKTLMVHHNIYNSWSWIGGHADGMEDLCAVALKELQEETGVKYAQLVSEEIFSLETLTVDGHMRKGLWVPSHLHFINRLDFGKKYCHNSPTVEESILQRAVMRAIMETAQQNLGVLQTLKVHIGMGLQSEQTEDNSMELQIRIAEIDAEFKAMLAKISTDTVDAFEEEKAKRLMDEKAHLQQQLGNIRDGQLKREQTQSRLDDIYTMKQPLTFEHPKV